MGRTMSACWALALLSSACVVETTVHTERRPRPAGASLGFIYEQYPGAPGVLVRSVNPGHSAERAGVMRGDCIMAVGGRPLAPDTNVLTFFDPFTPGERVTVDLVRDNRPLTVEAVLDPPPPIEWRGPSFPKLVFTTSPVCMKSIR